MIIKIRVENLVTRMPDCNICCVCALVSKRSLENTAKSNKQKIRNKMEQLG